METRTIQKSNPWHWEVGDGIIARFYLLTPGAYTGELSKHGRQGR